MVDQTCPLYEIYPGSGRRRNTRPLTRPLVRGLVPTTKRELFAQALADGDVLDLLDPDTCTLTCTRASTATGWHGETLEVNEVAHRRVEVFPGMRCCEVFIGAAGTHGNAAADKLVVTLPSAIGNDAALILRIATKGHSILGGVDRTILMSTSGDLQDINWQYSNTANATFTYREGAPEQNANWYMSDADMLAAGYLAQDEITVLGGNYTALSTVDGFVNGVADLGDQTRVLVASLDAVTELIIGSNATPANHINGSLSVFLAPAALSDAMHEVFADGLGAGDAQDWGDL